MAKLPGFMFYPGDWMKDADLRRCSHASRGVWIDMLCLMFECEERGVLASSGVPWTREEIAHAVGGATDVTIPCIDELVRKGVVRRRRDGALYSARLVRDEEQRRKTADRVQKHREKCNGDVTHLKRSCTESESEDEKETQRGSGGEPPGFTRFWKTYPRKIGKRTALAAWKRLKLESQSDVVVAAVKTQKASDQWQAEGGKFIPHPTTWLNRGSWEDEVGPEPETRPATDAELDALFAEGDDEG